MTFPLNEEEFTDMWLGAICNPDEGDEALVAVIVKTINIAYGEGVKDGMRKVSTTV